ncbi:MAG: chromosome segregation in meiosis- protein [Piccolia ochrophora]|nr:MAG: chromosome segregation in meiosis- protein [Piccolia ochrophora]
MATADVNPFLDNYVNHRNSPDPAAPPRNGVNTSAPDALDDLFDYDAGMDDMFRDVDTNMNAPTKDNALSNAAGGRAGAKRGADALGIDEEVQVKKKRIVVKLDEAKLLSDKGIPKLRRIARERLHFKGKGHEFSDVTKLLNFYQLWLDDLFPKAKFADALTIIEKLGHTKRMQTMRRGWIDEGKPRAARSRDTSVEALEPRREEAPPARISSAVSSQDPPLASGALQPGSPSHNDDRLQTPPVNDPEEDDMYTVTPGRRQRPASPTNSVPGDDELDTLLAEEASVRPPNQGEEELGVESVPEGDELDALLAEAGM